MQEGYVVECSGSGDGYTASVSLYENSQFGDEATAVIETADGTLIGVTNDGPFLTDNTIDLVLPLAPEGNPDDPIGSATVSGSYTVSGDPHGLILRSLTRARKSSWPSVLIRR